MRYNPESTHSILDPLEFLPSLDAETAGDLGGEGSDDGCALSTGAAGQ
jgi:hypothetical protein